MKHIENLKIIFQEDGIVMKFEVVSGEKREQKEHFIAKVTGKSRRRWTRKPFVQPTFKTL